MLTLGIGLLLGAAANSASWLTGGSDGLQGVNIWPLLGRFDWDLYGYTAYSYSLLVLFLLFLFARRLIHSPFGLALRGIRENLVRMPAIGAPSRAHIRTVYTISAAMAGVAGALIAQTTQTVALDSLGFERSADVLVMVVLGGAGRLYGGLVGTIVFMIAHDQFSGIQPQYWYFWIGLLLVAVVMFLPNGILGGLSQSCRALEEAEMSAIALSTRAAVEELRLAGGGARHRARSAGRRALRADRAERRRQDHADQSDHRHAGAQCRADILKRRGHHRARAARHGCGGGWRAPSRSTRCFPG